MDPLDAEFMRRLTDIQRKYSRLSKQLQIRVEKWCQALSEECTNDTWRKNRNAYADLLAVQVSGGELGEPFDKSPPAGGPLEKLAPHLVLRARRGALEGGERKEVWQQIFAAAQRTRGALAARREVPGAMASAGPAREAVSDAALAPETADDAGAETGGASARKGAVSARPAATVESETSGAYCQRCGASAADSAAAASSTSEATIEAVQLHLELGALREELVSARAQVSTAQHARAAAERQAREHDARAEQLLAQLGAERARRVAETRELRNVLQRSQQRARELQEQKDSEVLSLKRYHAEQVLALVQRQERYFATLHKQQQQAAGVPSSSVATGAESESASISSPVARQPRQPLTAVRVGHSSAGAVAAVVAVRREPSGSTAGASLGTPTGATPATPLSFALSPPTPSSAGRHAESASEMLAGHGSAGESYDSADAAVLWGGRPPPTTASRLAATGPAMKRVSMLRTAATSQRDGAGLQARLQAQLDAQQFGVGRRKGTAEGGRAAAAETEESGSSGGAALDTSLDTTDWRGQLEEHQLFSRGLDETPPRTPLGAAVAPAPLLQQARDSRLHAERPPEGPSLAPTSAGENPAIEHVSAAASVAFQRKAKESDAAPSREASAAAGALTAQNAAGFEGNPAWNVSIVPLPSYF